MGILISKVHNLSTKVVLQSPAHVCVFCFVLLPVQHVDIPDPGVESTLQVQPAPQLWQQRILNPLCWPGVEPASQCAGDTPIPWCHSGSSSNPFTSTENKWLDPPPHSQENECVFFRKSTPLGRKKPLLMLVQSGKQPGAKNRNGVLRLTQFLLK